MMRWLVASCLLLLAAGVSARTPKNSILGVLERNRHTTTLATVLKLFPEFKTAITTPSTAITVFAPSNKAFQVAFKALGIKKVDSSNSAIIANVLKYHIVPAVARARDLKHRQTLPTLLGNNVTLAVDLKAIRHPTIRGRNSDAVVIDADNKAGKGIIHVVDDVLLPINLLPIPFKNIAEAAVGANLTSLVAAVQRAGLLATLSDPNLEATVFAPSNKAFAKALKALNLTLETVPVATLKNILLYHVVPAYKTTSSIVAWEQLPTLFTPNKLKPFYLSYGRNRLRIRAAQSTAKVDVPNVFAGRGVVHVVDTVLLPKL